MYDLIVVGGGPAGLTATVYAIRKRLNVLMLTKDLGGKTQYRLALPWIQDYQVIRGLETVNKFRSELEYLEFARKMDTAEKITKEGDHFVIATKSGEILQAKAVVLATGARQVRLNVPGEKEFTMRGLCYSALSYAPLFIDKITVVIGDGDLALSAAGELATVAKHVTLVCKDDDILSTPLGNKLSAAKNVTIFKDYQVVEFKGDEFAENVVLKDPSGKVSEIAAEGTFIEMALTPMSQMVADLVKLDEHGRIIVDCGNRTNVPGFFAAGDVTNTYAEQVLVAVGEGAKAALSAYEYLLPTL
ncbi:MAG: FAD-dependent oxidoreductase [Anaerolineales bacterium]|nr:FAD-dependent oxidoreductase [Anaerolineales bacterium]